MIQQTESTNEELKKLLLSQDFVKIPKAGDVVKGKIVFLSKHEVRLEIEGYKTGVARGPELANIKSVYPDLKIGDEVEATVIELENENGEVELSFRFTGERMGWDELKKLKQEGQVVSIKILEANQGGLIATTGNQIIGFLPVSQLSPKNYPRVPGGERMKILERLREFAGKSLRAKVLDVDEKEGKLIFSEKILWEEEQKELLAKFKVGDIIEGTVTALADFGAFVAFSGEGEKSAGGDGMEGLAHISEIAWQRLDHPADVLKVGDKVKAKIIGVEGSKIFLSLRQLMEDPWTRVKDRYQMNQIVEGKVLKVNPFGLFVELDPEIHGLAHVSEVDLAPGEKLEAKVKPGDKMEFRVVSIEPEAHRLGLSQKAVKEPAKEQAPATEEKPVEMPEEPKTEDQTPSAQ